MPPPAGWRRTTEEEARDIFQNDPRGTLRDIVNTAIFPLTALANHPPCPFQCRGCPFCQCSLTTLAECTDGYEGPYEDPEYGKYVIAVTYWREGLDDVIKEEACRKEGVRIVYPDIDTTYGIPTALD
jgi:hypothetical protein